MDTKGIELVSEVNDIHKIMHMMVIVIGCLMIFQSNPPSYNSRKIKTNITPKRRGSVGSVSAANSENSTVSENGVKNKMKYTSLSRATKTEKRINKKTGSIGSTNISNDKK